MQLYFEIFFSVLLPKDSKLQAHFSGHYLSEDVQILTEAQVSH